MANFEKRRIATIVAKRQLEQRYVAREVIYLLGTHDTPPALDRRLALPIGLALQKASINTPAQFTERGAAHCFRCTGSLLGGMTVTGGRYDRGRRSAQQAA
jgi:hypothetical protein